VQVGELTLTVHQATRSASAFAVLTVDTKPDGSGQTITLRLGAAPDLARALLDLFCCGRQRSLAPRTSLRSYASALPAHNGEGWGPEDA
jgi:hypothetical protein